MPKNIPLKKTILNLSINAATNRMEYRIFRIMLTYIASCRTDTTIKIEAITKVSRKTTFSKPRLVNEAFDLNPLPNPVPLLCIKIVKIKNAADAI